MKYLLLFTVLTLFHCTSLDQSNPIDTESDSYTAGNEIDSDGNGISDYYDKRNDDDEDGIINGNDPDSKWYTESGIIEDDTSDSSIQDIDHETLDDDSTITEIPADSSDDVDDTTQTDEKEDEKEEDVRDLFYYTNHTSFDPSGDSLSRVIVPSDGSLEEAQGYTLFIWVNIDSDCIAGGTILERTFEDGVGIPFRLSVQVDGVGLYKYNFDPSDDGEGVLIPVVRDEWVLIAITANKTETVMSSFDATGTLLSTTQENLSYIENSDKGFTLGYITRPGDFGEYKFTGKMNGFGITSDVLETDEIVSYVKDNLESNSTAFYYPLDEGSGSTFTDEINSDVATGYTEW